MNVLWFYTTLVAAGRYQGWSIDLSGSFFGGVSGSVVQSLEAANDASRHDVPLYDWLRGLVPAMRHPCHVEMSCY